MRFSALLLLLIALSSCTMRRMYAGRTKAPSQRQLVAGVARVDITPPAGLSLWGHGPESRVATGRMTGLWCQVFVFVGPTDVTGRADTDGLALVTCDLSWSSLVLQRQVARRVAVRSAELGMSPPFGADRIWVMATHTHAGVGHLWPWASYTGPLSSRLRGFDIDVVNFVAGRIGDAIVEAYRRRRAARLVWGKEDVYGIGRNRSLAAFERNQEQPASLPWPAMDAKTKRPLSAPERAVDPQLSVLRIDALEPMGMDPTGPMGVLAVFGVHPTVVANDNQLYHGDLFGFAADHARRKTHVVVGIANGIEGDVAPQKLQATPREARRLGEALGNRIVEVFEKLGDDVEEHLQEHAVIQAAYRDLELPNAPTCRGNLCAVPMLGAAAGGGAEDSPTTLRVIPHNNPGVRRRDDALHPCHGEKLGIQGPLRAFEAGKDFPAFAPIGLARIGNGVIATIPAEATTVAGIRMREAIAAQFSDDPEVVAVAGLTGGYIQYVATSDEYRVQLYEGASTLYGPHTAELLSKELSRLARHLEGAPPAAHDDHHPPVDNPAPVSFTAADAELMVCAGSSDRQAARCSLFPPPCVGSLDLPVRRVATPDGESAYELEFRRDSVAQGGVLNHALLDVSVELIGENGTGPRIAHDRGTRVAVRAFGDRYRRWKATWRPRRANCGATHRIVVVGRQHSLHAPCAEGVTDGKVISEPFVLRCDEGHEPRVGASP